MEKNGKNIEFSVRFKAAIIYIIAALGVAAMTLYLNNLRKGIFSQRAVIENQHNVLSKTNDLMYALNEAQSSASLFLATKNEKYFNNYIQTIDSVNNLIDTIAILRPAGAEKLQRIVELLQKQAESIKELSNQFAQPQPPLVSSSELFQYSRELLRSYEPRFIEDSFLYESSRVDTILTNLPRRNFFQRLSEAFSAKKKSTMEVVVTNETEWKRKEVEIDSMIVVYQVVSIANTAEKLYDKKMKVIEEQVNALISADREITKEVAALLLDFHKETLEATISIINNSEKLIEQNYVYLTIGGLLALGLILFFIILIITDINKGRKARRALEIANEQIQKVMDSRHKLLLSVSHDIKSPLNSILGYLSVMKTDANVRSMQHSSEHILSMLENLLEFSRLEQGTPQKSMSDFNLKDLFEDVYNMFLPLADQKSLALSFAADDIRIHTDRVKLKQIVINLVSNAVKYTQKGAVEFAAQLDEYELIIEVKDTGVGIPAKKIPQLFEPFSRIEENTALAEGTGLGMFVVKGLVELLGGNIHITSNVGKGTTISAIIPAEQSTKRIPQGAKRIKIYDDDPVMIEVVTEMLLRLGHTVVGADYDLIITDMDMGDISGIDILHGANGVPVVLMTGSIEITTHEALKLGFDGFLAKPFTIESLREIIGSAEQIDEFLGDNKEEFTQLFRASAEKNLLILKQALADNDFNRAQAVCHKLFPMFAQFGYPTKELHNMDTNRNNEYKNWQKDVEKIVGVFEG